MANFCILLLAPIDFSTFNILSYFAAKGETNIQQFAKW